jgi:hypothetical protein
VTTRADARDQIAAAREVLTAIGAAVTGLGVIRVGQAFAVRARIARPVDAELPDEVNGVRLLVVIDTESEDAT